MNKNIALLLMLMVVSRSATAQEKTNTADGQTKSVVTSLNTTGSLSAVLAPAIPNLPSPNLGWLDDPDVHQASRKFTVGVPYKNMAPELLLAGGHTLLDSVFSKFTALPYGAGDNGGCVFSVLMSYTPLTGTNCGAGAYESVADYTLAVNNPPWYIAGAEFKDENGTSHSLTFSNHEAFLRPALPTTYMQFMHAGAHVVTNVAAGSAFRGGWPAIDGVDAHRGLVNPLYAQNLAGWRNATDSQGSYTVLTMQGQWQPFTGQLKNGAKNVDAGHAPSVGSNNIAAIRDSVDVIEGSFWPTKKQPFIEIGTYVKHFTRNTTCSVQVDNDETNPKNLSPSRDCDEELDNWYSGPDYGATMHGLTIGSQFNNKVSSDSYGLGISGQWPTGVRINIGSSSMDIDGDAFKVTPRLGPDKSIGSKQEVFEFDEEPFKNSGWTSQFKMWQQVDTNGFSDPNGYQNQHDTSWWMGPRYGDSIYSMSEGASNGGATVYNPGWAKGGAALCGSNASKFLGKSPAGTACLTVDDWGDTSTSGTITANNGIKVVGSIDVSGGGTFGGNVNMTTGKSIFLAPAANDAASVFAYGDVSPVQKSPELHISNSKGGWSYIRVDSVIGTLGTPANSSAPCDPGQSQDDQNYHYVCTSPNHWRRIALQDF